MPPRQQSHKLGIASRPARTPPARQQRTGPRAPARASTLQAGRTSYYFSPGQGHRVTTPGGYTVGRAPGSVYRVSSPGGQHLEGKVRLPRRTYHRIVLAEFIGTVLIIAAAPIVVPPKSTAAGTAQSTAASVSFAGPLVRLTAVCVVFFVLALMATGEKSGKVAAAFGGLVLTGAALNAGDLWSALASAIGATKPASASSASSGGETAAQQEQSSGIAPGATGRAGT